jgi:uncharacterized protein YkwD
MDNHKGLSMRRVFVLVSLLIICSAAAVASAQSSVSLTRRVYLPVIVNVPPAPTPTPPPLSFEDRVLMIVNQHRANAGCAPLYTSVQLTSAAENHSADMAANDYFSHTGLDGSSPSLRAQAAGYPFGAGENIAAGQSTPEEVVAAWMGSSGHRANILNCSYRTTGIGYVFDANDTFGPYFHYWTQMFGLQ